MKVEYLLWIPIIGLFAMIRLTKLRYDTKYFVGLFWIPYQGMCVGVFLILLASNIL